MGRFQVRFIRALACLRNMDKPVIFDTSVPHVQGTSLNVWPRQSGLLVGSVFVARAFQSVADNDYD